MVSGGNSLLWRLGICQSENVNEMLLLWLFIYEKVARRITNIRYSRLENMMDKIYRRATQLSDTPKKKKNEKNRTRNTIMNFRVSPQEKELIDARITLSGLPRAEYFISSCLYQSILVKGNIKTFGEINSKVKEISKVILENNRLTDLNIEQQESFQTILEILNNLYGKGE